MIAVFDNFIKDEELIKKVATDMDIWGATGAYKYWKGWWNKEASNTAQELAQYIFRDNYPLTEGLNIDGFEYWSGIQSAEMKGRRNYLELHYDDDVNYRKEKGDRMLPVLGCVYYPVGSQFEGGDLAIYTDGEDKSPELIKSKPNRLIIFEPGKVVHGVQEVTKGTRRGIAINLWDQEPWSVQNGFITLE